MMIPRHIAEVLETDPRIVRIVHYLDGWVPNAYKWPAPGHCDIYTREADETIAVSRDSYDRKRSYGAVRRYVGLMLEFAALLMLLVALYCIGIIYA